MFDYIVTQTDRGKELKESYIIAKTYWPLVVGHGVYRCRTIVHVKSEDVGFTLLVMTG